jgi:hypothetical protein
VLDGSSRGLSCGTILSFASDWQDSVLTKAQTKHSPNASQNHYHFSQLARSLGKIPHNPPHTGGEPQSLSRHSCSWYATAHSQLFNWLNCYVSMYNTQSSSFIHLKILKAEYPKSSVFWDVILCSPVTVTDVPQKGSAAHLRGQRVIRASNSKLLTLQPWQWR